MSLRSVFIDNIKFYRKKARFSQQQLAEKCDISPNYLSEIETGKKFPSVEMIEMLAKNLSIQPYLLFLDTGKITINTEIAYQKRNNEFSEKLIQNVTNLLKEYGFLE